jgi:hypothetical protein
MCGSHASSLLGNHLSRPSLPRLPQPPLRNPSLSPSPTLSFSFSGYRSVLSPWPSCLLSSPPAVCGVAMARGARRPAARAHGPPRRRERVASARPASAVARSQPERARAPRHYIMRAWPSARDASSRGAAGVAARGWPARSLACTVTRHGLPAQPARPRRARGGLRGAASPSAARSQQRPVA